VRQDVDFWWYCFAGFAVGCTFCDVHGPLSVSHLK
jgi:hypothetical protein